MERQFGGGGVGGGGGGEGGGVSDQGSRFGLVASVPLHVCQLRAQGAAEEAAVAERPAAHREGRGRGQGAAASARTLSGLMWPVQLLNQTHSDMTQ